MRTVNTSGEAGELPATNPQEPEKFLPGICKEDDEPNRARRHLPEGPARHGLRQDTVPGPEPASGLALSRKTELHDKPPGSRSYRAATAPATGCPDLIVKEPAGQIAALNDRPGAVESRIDRAIRPGHRLLTPGHPGES